MKDFIKWLGVNEKIAKVVVWSMILMTMLILTNAMLNSIGFPHYQITYQNLKALDESIVLDTISSLIVCFLNFGCIVLLVFRTKETKPILKYAILYTVLSWIVTRIFNYVVLQIFILLFILIFCYFYSNKNWKYIIYGIISLVINTAIQGITYAYKMKMIDFSNISDLTRALISIDYFIIMAVIILVKEIYLRKRGEKVCITDQEVGFGLANSKEKTNSQKKWQKK